MPAPLGARMRSSICLAALLALLFSAVGAQDAAKSLAPKLPWELPAVREAWSFGLVLTFKFESVGKPAEKHVLEFAEEGADGITKTRTVSVGGTARAEKPSYMTWEQHMESLTDQLAGAQESEEQLKVGEKTYACKVLTVGPNEATGIRKRQAWFCKDVAGMWVKYVVERKDGVESHTLESIDTLYHNPGWRPAEIAPALRAGATFKYRYTDEQRQVSFFTLSITEGNDEGFKEVIAYLDQNQKPEGEPVSTRQLWQQYARGFMFAKSLYNATESQMEFAGRKLDCVLMTLTETRGEATRVVITTLSKKHPGVIIARHNTIKSGNVTLKTVIELVEMPAAK